MALNLCFLSSLGQTAHTTPHPHPPDTVYITLDSIDLEGNWKVSSAGLPVGTGANLKQPASLLLSSEAHPGPLGDF